jgi:uncharacterized protein
MATKNFIQRHAIVIYFILAYTIAWSGVILMSGTARFQGQAVPVERVLLAFPAMLLWPSLSGILMTALLDGKKGLRELFARLSPRRVQNWRFAAAFLINPLLTLGILLALSALVSPAFRPVTNPLGLVVGGLAGFFEEIGWTGFATPRLLEKHSSLKASLILGLLWGIWHLMAGFIGSAPGQEMLWMTEAVLFWVLGLVAYRVLMTWVYCNTRILLFGQLMHLVFTGSFFAFVPALPYGLNVLFYVVLSAATWVIVAVVVRRYGKSLQGKPAKPARSQTRPSAI